MSDRGWLLNHSAIAAAKVCIQIVQRELGVKLKLSHPQFIELLSDYCELTEASDLLVAYQELMVFADGEPEAVVSPKSSVIQDESVAYKGKSYPRFDEQGREFKGLYRGGARYA